MSYSTITGIDVYLWFIGGKECISSILVLMCMLENAGRWLTRASHKINKKYNTATTDTIDPTLAKIFQNINVSG